MPRIGVLKGNFAKDAFIGLGTCLKRSSDPGLLFEHSISAHNSANPATRSRKGDFLYKMPINGVVKGNIAKDEFSGPGTCLKRFSGPG
jgi:hypothetical protein